MKRIIAMLAITAGTLATAACGHSTTRTQTVVVARNVVVDRIYIPRTNCWTVEFINTVTKARGKSGCLRGGKAEMLSYHNGDNFPH